MPRRPAFSDLEFDGNSEPENDEEPRSSRRRAAPELHARERPMPQSDEHRHRAVEASNRGTPRRPSSGVDEDDEELQKVFKASLAEQKASQQRIRQREKRIAVREAADEAAAIAESVRLAALPTAAQRQEAVADAELERVLRESTGEAKGKKARRRASLLARFGENSGQQPRSSSSRDSAPSASSQRERENSVPQSPTGPSTGQRERSNSAPREPAASSAEQPTSVGENLLRRGVQLIRRSSGRAKPAVQQPRRAASARLAEISVEPEPPSSPAALSRPNAPRVVENPARARPDPPRAAKNPPGARPDTPRAAPNLPRARPDPPRAAPNPPRARPDHPRAAPNHPRARPDPPRVVPNSPRAPANPTRERAVSPGRQPGGIRRQPHAPAEHQNPLGRRNSESAPHVERLPRGRASSSPRRYPGQPRNRGELEPSIRQALNNSERWARMEQGRGAHNLREEEQMRMALQNSLGDAPPPPDPIEGLLDPPPAYHKIGRDKKLDPLRYTTTNEKGNEPGHKRYITPEILAVMKKFKRQQERFDAKAQAAGQDLPPANNAMAKKQKRAPVLDNSPVAGSSSSAANTVDSLENLLGTRPPPPRLARGEPRNRAAAPANNNAFVSRVPGLASNARERVPQSRPWDNAFSRLPRDRGNPSGRH